MWKLCGSISSNDWHFIGINWHSIGIYAVRLSAKKWQYVKLAHFESTEDFCYELVKLKMSRWWSRGESNTETWHAELVKRLAIGIILA